MRWLLRPIVALAGVVLLLVGGTLALARAEHPPRRCLAFIDRGGAGRVYSVCPNGQPATPLIAPDDEFTSLAAAPDGERVALARWSDEEARLYVLDPRTTRLTALELGLLRGIEALAWSPDGAWIAFIAEPDGLYRVHPDGSELAPITMRPEAGYQAVSGAPDLSWSPDSQWLVFVARRENFQAIYRVRVDGTELQRLTDSPHPSSDPAWSPDGAWIAYVEQQGGNMDIMRMRADGTDAQRLTSDRTAEMAPAWSPDGAWIAYLGELPERWTPFRMQADGSGSEPIALPVPLNDDKPLWSPDGARLAVVGRWPALAFPQLAQMTAAGRAFERLTALESPPAHAAWIAIPAAGRPLTPALAAACVLIVLPVLRSWRRRHDAPVS